MQANGCRKSGRGRASWRVGFAVLSAALALALAESGASAAPTETVLHSFTGGVGDGIFPFAGLIADSAGNLYGTTNQGGAANDGVVFKLSPGGIETVLYSFCGKPGCSDGAGPGAGLIADRHGNLYGTTPGGGAANAGVVFKLSPGGIETVLYSFCGKPGCSDGAGPGAGLIADRLGNLYGTTGGGGGPGCDGLGCGVVFKLSPPIPPATKWTETVLHSFVGSDGGRPSSGLIADSKGNLYGTTGVGGASDRGVVFKLAPNGTETVLYSFCSLTNCSDGASPLGGLIADSAGNLYGTTNDGGGSGCNYGPGLCGVVFKLSPGGTETVLHAFAGGSSDGAGPWAGLIADASGNLYGTTKGGGATGCPPPGCGVVFKLVPGGTETVLYSFCSLTNCSDGIYPTAGLIADSSGNLYGTASGDDLPRIGGVVFELAGTGFVTDPSWPLAPSFRWTSTPSRQKTPSPSSSSLTLSSTAPAISPLTQAVALHRPIVHLRGGRQWHKPAGADHADGNLALRLRRGGGTPQLDRDYEPGAGDADHRRRQWHEIGHGPHRPLTRVHPSVIRFNQTGSRAKARRAGLSRPGR